jgi:hypothetical protein
VSTHYNLLGIPRTAAPEDVKRAFRREVARYHPDKVQHLGPEFQAIATSRAAALTEAYRTLMNEDLRRHYDQQLSPSADRPARVQSPAAPVVPSISAREPVSEPIPNGRTGFAPANGAGTVELVKRAVLARVNDAARLLGSTPAPATAFDAVFRMKGRQPVFRKAEPGVRLAVRVVPQVDVAAMQAAWLAAVRLPDQGETLCLMLLGSGLAPAGELARSVSDLRRKTRGIVPLVIPVDLRDWQALLPPETPPAVRSLLDRIRQGE